jgi:hypothetical protein
MSSSSSSYEHVTTSTKTSSVPHGSSLVTHGVATLGPLRVTCGGEINEQLWGAGACLASYLYSEQGRSLLANSPEVIELGSGTGLTGLAAAISGAGSVILTDQAHCVDTLSNTIAENEDVIPPHTHVSAAALPWGDSSALSEVSPLGCDLIVGADLLYNPETFPALLSTIAELAAKRPAKILIATEQRWESVSEYVRAFFGRTSGCRGETRRGRTCARLG